MKLFKGMARIGILCVSCAVVFISCDAVVSAPASTPLQVTIQVEQEAVIDAGATVQTTSNGNSIALKAISIPDYLFIKWVIVSGTGAALENANKASTTISFSTDVVVKAVYLKAYYNAFNHHYYKYFNTPKTWSEARDICESYGGCLVTVTDALEQSFVSTILMTSEVTGTYFWIGNFQPTGSAEPGGNWQWLSGENWSYTNWSASEPTNSGVGESLSAFVKSGLWVDLSDIAYSFICEWSGTDNFLHKQSFNGHTYGFVDIFMTWDQAKNYANRLGAHLAVINSKIESDFIIGLVASGTKSYYWLGAQQTGVSEPGEGWSWLTGENLSTSTVFSNWVTAQPDNLPAGANKLLLRKIDGQWLDDVNSPTLSSGIILEWDK